MRIRGYRLDIVREPLVRPFAFKGGSFSEKWLTLISLESESGNRAEAPGGLAVLWSDPAVFASHSEAGGNIVLCAVAEFAARQLTQLRSDRLCRPDELLAQVFPAVHAYAAAVTGIPTVRTTATLNALVSIDLALWKLYALETGAGSFDELLPAEFRPPLGYQHTQVAHIPLISYTIPPHEIRGMADRGSFLFKIKIGQSGTEPEMLRKDCDRLADIQRQLKTVENARAPGGRVLYYLDANGRYRSKVTVLKLLEYLDSIGMLGQVILLEEPFARPDDIDVSDLPVRVAADESVETDSDVRQRAEAGYGALALKPAGKTLSVSLAMAREAWQRDMPCFVADSACVPVLVDWNKNVAARLAPLPGLSTGALESNGADHYRRWKELLCEHPCAGAGWLSPRDGVFTLGGDFYEQSGGVLR
ncbi:MAG: L-alanine-DL-glutamate epimerase [Spirochaetaceae bacterium]|nr:MAG: L-alanine-DL-glutamate epimerase [Spirochaetaceae bacterium]